MSNIDVTRDAAPMPKNPIDPNANLPPSVRASSAAAEALHASVYGPPKVDPAAVEVQPAAPPAPAPVPAPPPAPAPRQPAAPVAPEEWEHRYNSMKGRYDQSQQNIGQMQEQMQELGNELIRSQHALRERAAPPPAPVPREPTRLLTDKDVENYGPDLIDTVKRAAIEAVAPQLTNLETENRQLRQAVTVTRQEGVYEQLAAKVPDWKAVNTSNRFLKWLNLPDVYSGRLRKDLLGQAFRTANAPRVIAFFEGFLSEEQATGQVPLVPSQQQHNAPARTAALSLDTLAAPGRARPATGTDVAPGAPAATPVYTRAEISRFYSDIRKGVYKGKDVAKDQIEQAIFQAQREGRVR